MSPTNIAEEDCDELVSIIIPTYFRNESLRTAIESALRQDYENTEIIVVDDSGERFAEPLVEEFEVNYVAHKENQGGNPARNTGYRHCSGEYIQFLDDDDEIKQEKVSTQHNMLTNSPEAEVAYAGIVGSSGRVMHPESMDDVSSLEKALQFIWPTTITSSLLISDSVLSEVIPLADRRAADDIGMKIELAQRTEFVHTDRILTKIGDSPNSRSSKESFVYELESIFDEYESLYGQFPDRVKEKALSNLYQAKARRRLSVNIWSSRAIYSHISSIYYNPSPGIPQYGEFIAALFGRPGTRVASKIYDYIQ